MSYPSSDGPIAPERILIDYTHEAVLGSTTQSATVTFNARMQTPKLAVRSLRLVGWTIENVPNEDGEASATLGEAPWVPYYLIEFQGMNQGVDSSTLTRGGGNADAQRLFSMPLILKQAGYNSSTFENTGLQEVLRVDNPQHSIRSLKVRVSVPDNTTVPSVVKSTGLAAGSPVAMFSRITLHLVAYPVTRIEGLSLRTALPGDPENVPKNYYESRRAQKVQRATDEASRF